MSEVRKLRRSLMIWSLIGIAAVIVGAAFALSTSDTGGQTVGVVLLILGVVVAVTAFVMRLRLEHSAGKYSR